MAQVETAIQVTFGHEGVYSNDKNDSGGATKYGVTEKVACGHGYKGDMKDMPIEFAIMVYKNYWKDAWNNINSQVIANELFDTEINTGGVADLIGQAALNSLNRSGTLFPNMTTDGKLGNVGVQGINILINNGDSGVLLKVLNHLQGAYYVACSAGDKAKESFLTMLKETSNPGNEKQETFMRGWMANRT